MIFYDYDKSMIILWSGTIPSPIRILGRDVKHVLF